MIDNNSISKPSIQLFLLPYAGGNAASFKQMTTEISSKIQVIPVEYSGRGARISEGYINTYDKFLVDIAQYIKVRRNVDIPYALFGYSMGASIAYDLVSRQLLDQDPAHVIYGARECVSYPYQRELTEEEFIEYVKSLGGFPDEVSNSKLFKLYLHPLIDDYKVIRQFCFEEGKVPDCDITVFYCEKDTPFTRIADWKKLTKGNTAFYELGNSHFFIKEHYKKMAEVINKTLQ